MKVLIVGGSGYVGQYLARDLPKLVKCTFYATFNSNNVFEEFKETFPFIQASFQVDLSHKSNKMADLLSDLQPDVIVNVSAMSDVTKCHNQPSVAFAVNDPSWWMCGYKCKLFIHFSTDMVYHGDNGPYSETFDPDPLPSLVYGVSKREGEKNLLKSEIPIVILRSALVIGPPSVTSLGRGSCIDWMKRMIAEATIEKKAKLFENEFRSPVLVSDIVKVVAELIKNPSGGVFNMGGKSDVSRYEIGVGLAKKLGVSSDVIQPVLQEPIQNGIERPRDLRMDSSKLEKLLHVRMSTLEESLDYIFTQQ